MSLPNNDKLISFLNKLFDTNEEFSNIHDNEFFAQFHDRQDPALTILKCSDSRVQMESFDKTPQNDVFAIRNIGNQIITSEGSIDFGVRILKTPFLLVIGHSDCAAIRAGVNKEKTNIPAIDNELATIDVKSTNIKDAIVENINSQISFAIKKYKDLIEVGDLTVMGVIYDFQNDFGFGHGIAVLNNVNGVTDSKKIQLQYGESVKKLHC